MTSLTRRKLVSLAAATGLATVPQVRSALAQEATPGASPAVESGDSRTIAAVNGEITVSGTPERVIVMEYELAENLAILEVEPVGVSERDSISQWVQIPPYAEHVVDIGTRDEPDIEAIIGLAPDLILAASPRQDEVLANLEAVAPVVQLATYSPFFAPEGLTPHESFQSVLLDVARAVNKVEQAESVIADFDTLLAAGTEAIGATEYAGRSFVYASITSETEVNVFNDRSRIAYTFSQLGLVNLGVENEESPGLHYVANSIEQLGALPADTLFFIAMSPANREEIETITSSDFWNVIPLVSAGNFYNLGEPNIWTAGSAITISDLIRRVVKTLAGTDLS